MRRELRRDVARTLVAVLGTLPGAWLAAAALALWWPGPESVGHAVGFVATLPLWVFAMCVAFLDERAWRAAVGSIVLAMVAYAALSIGESSRGGLPGGARGSVSSSTAVGSGSSVASTTTLRAEGRRRSIDDQGRIQLAIVDPCAVSSDGRPG